MAAFTTLSEVKRHLNKTSNTDDDELQTMIDAASEVVASLVGSFDAEPVTERITGSGGTALLSRRPVVGPVTVDGLPVGEAYINRPAGLLYDVLPSYSPLTVTYSVGGGAVPAAVSLATQIIAAHLWETQRGAASPVGPLGDDAIGQTPIGFAIPNRAAQLLEPFARSNQIA